MRRVRNLRGWETDFCLMTCFAAVLGAAPREGAERARRLRNVGGRGK
jgi:hypothetical protein